MHINFAIPTLHPRVYMDRGTLKILKKRISNNNYKTAMDSIYSSIQATDKHGFREIEAYAFLYLVLEKEEDGYKAIKLLNEFLNFNKKYKTKKQKLLSIGQMLHTLSLVYDWCYNLLSDEEKNTLVAFVHEAIQIIRNMYSKNDLRDIIINISESQLIRDLMAVSVAIYDEEKEIFNKINKKFLQEYVLFRNFISRSEGYPQGVNFGAIRASFDMHLIWLSSRLGNTDIFSKTIGLEPYYIIYMRRPDGFMMHDGDKEQDLEEKTFLFSKIFMHASSYYKDPIFHKEFLSQLSNINFRCDKLSNNRIDPVEFMLFYDDTVTIQDKSTLPETKFFPQPIGAMVCRTGWDTHKDSDNVIAYFKIGIYNFNGHQHLDSGQFQVYYRGYLAIDSGGYAKDGDAHDINYHKRTVAHNCMVFIKSREKMRYKNNEISNDGGQIFWGLENNSFNVKDLSANGQRVGMFINESKTPDAGKPRYSFLRGLIKGAYGTKVKTYGRMFLFIRTGEKRCPAIICIIDEMKTNYKKTYLLHSKYKPQILFNNVIIKDDIDGYAGKLIHSTVFPLANEINIEVVGGEHNSFYVDSKNHQVKLSKEEKKIQETGEYRAEITSKMRNVSGFFMNVMQVTDAESEFAYEAIPCVEEHKAVIIKDYKIYFLNNLTYQFEVKSIIGCTTNFVIINGRLGFYGIGSKDQKVYMECECRDNMMLFTLPPGEYFVKLL